MLLVLQAQKEDCEDDKAAGFQIGMRLEAIDRKYPDLSCVVSIADVRKNELLIHIDGRGKRHDYWCQSDSTDIHPVGWCEENDKELQEPHGKLIIFG